MSAFLKNICVVLARAENPVNIGQAARALKNFGVSSLSLVQCSPHQVDEAYTPGWKAKRILDQAKCFRSLPKALKGSGLSIGFTTRRGRLRGESSPLADVIPQILETARSSKVHLVFGNEKNGLSNEELGMCDRVATIPANPVYPSLNLSHAVAITLASIFAQSKKSQTLFKKEKRLYATAGEFEGLMKEFYETLKRLGYKNHEKNDLLDRVHEKIGNYFRENWLDRNELHLFRSFVSHIRQRIH